MTVYNFVDAGEAVRDDYGSRSIIEIHASYQPNAEFRCKAPDSHSAIERWNRANATTTHTGVIFSIIN